MFKVGDKVVYPMHGAGVIEKIEKKEVLGEVKEYYILSLPIKSMKVMLPVNNVENLGIRSVVDEKTLLKVLDLLSGEKSQMPSNWNRRYRANMDRVKTGDIFEVAEVVRDLELMDRDKGLSTGERKMLNNTKQILISEFVLCKDIDEDEAKQMIDLSIGKEK